MDFARLSLLVSALFVAVLVQSATAQAGKNGLGSNCTTAADCSSVANATCPSKKCVCSAAFKVAGSKCAPKVIGDNCTATPDCAAVKNATCDTPSNNKCICPVTYKPAANGQCKAKGLGDTCKVKSECVAVNLSVCHTTSKKCECPDTHKNVSGKCQTKGLGDSCKASAECTAVTTSICNTTSSHMCECPATHKAVSGQCKLRVIGASCSSSSSTGSTVCSLSNSECKNSTCACVSGFHNVNDQCEADSSAESQRIAVCTLGASLLLTIFKIF